MSFLFFVWDGFRGTGDPSPTVWIVGGIFSRYPLFVLEKSKRLCYTTLL